MLPLRPLHLTLIHHPILLRHPIFILTMTNGRLSWQTKEKKKKLKRLLVCVVSGTIAAATYTSPTRDKRLNTVRFIFKNPEEHLSSRNFQHLYRVTKSHFKEFSALFKAKFQPSILYTHVHNPSICNMVCLHYTLRMLVGVSYVDHRRPYLISFPTFYRAFQKTHRVKYEALPLISFSQS